MITAGKSSEFPAAAASKTATTPRVPSASAFNSSASSPVETTKVGLFCKSATTASRNADSGPATPTSNSTVGPRPKTTPKITMKRAGKARFQKSAARLRRLIFKLARTMAKREVMMEPGVARRQDGKTARRRDGKDERARGVEESRRNLVGLLHPLSAATPPERSDSPYHPFSSP